MAMDHAQGICDEMATDRVRPIVERASRKADPVASFACNDTNADGTKGAPGAATLHQSQHPIKLDAIINLYAIGNFVECINNALNVIQNDQHNALLRNILGAARARRSQFQEARDDFRKAIALKPDYAEAYNNLGNAFKEDNEIDAAILSYNRAISITPDYTDAHCNAGNALREKGLFGEALIAHKIAIALQPDNHLAYNNLGISFKEQGNSQCAAVHFQRSITINPSFTDAYNNLGSRQRDLGNTPRAEASFKKALILNPADSRAYNNLGNVHCDHAKLHMASVIFNRAHLINPAFAIALWNHSLIELLHGHFETGLERYEWRTRRKELRKTFPSFKQPRWEGTASPGQRIFIHSEQGLGDTLQFIRYVNVLRNAGVKPIVSVQNSLVPIISYAFPGVEIKPEKDIPDNFDYFIPLMSLPYAMGTTSETIPCDIPYLYAAPERVEKWSARLGLGGFKIGVCWQGSTGRVDKGRSFSLHELKNVARIPGVRLISLHKGAGESQLANLPDGMSVETLGEDFDLPGSAFLDTAAVMAVCDLVITSDTSVAHLAGAMGIPVWVVLKHVPDWRWMLDRPDSPWYPTMRLFRQDTAQDWRSAFAKIEAALRTMLMDRHGPADQFKEREV